MDVSLHCTKTKARYTPNNGKRVTGLKVGGRVFSIAT